MEKRGVFDLSDGDERGRRTSVDFAVDGGR
jgi:hypothetical protein